MPNIDSPDERRGHVGMEAFQGPWDCCTGCYACLEGCLGHRFGAGFNPRDIVVWARYGHGDRLLHDYSVIQQCFGCGCCRERCPQDLKPIDVIQVLKAKLHSGG